MPDLAPADLSRGELELERELWRRYCRSSLRVFCVEVLAREGKRPAEHHALFIREIEAVVSGDTARLILVAPRGSAKTTYVSILAAAWFFATHPKTTIIAVSHTAELAQTISARVQRLIREFSDILGYTLTSDARGQWETSNGCTYLALGVGQSPRGHRAALILMDDPIKSFAEADSEVYRDALWKFYHEDLLFCATPKHGIPGSGVIIIGTAFRDNDLLMQLERTEASTHRVVRVPAISLGEGDPLGRPEGVPIWADQPQVGYAAMVLNLQADPERVREFASQFQGRPYPAEGAMLLPDNIVIVDALPAGKVTDTARGYDLAASFARGDYSASVKIAHLWNHDRQQSLFVILDVQRIRGTPDMVRKMVRELAASDGYNCMHCLPQDPGQAGIDQATSYTDMLMGHRTQMLRQTGSKVNRAEPMAEPMARGRIFMLRAPWNRPLIEEFRSFPMGEFDDQVDAAAAAFNYLAPKGGILGQWARL